MAQLLILDTTILSNFGHVRRPNLIYALPSPATTAAVLREYQAAVNTGILPANLWSNLPIVALRRYDEEGLARNLHSGLGAGERTCLIAAIRHSAILATDDAKARRVARQWGISITGTVSLLVQAVRLGVVTLSEANELLRRMIQSG